MVPTLLATGYQAPAAWLEQIAQDTEKNDKKFTQRIANGKVAQKFGYYGAIAPIAEYFRQHPDTYLVSEGPNTLDIGRDMIGMQLPVIGSIRELGALWVLALVMQLLRWLKQENMLLRLMAIVHLVLMGWRLKRFVDISCRLRSLLSIMAEFITGSAKLFPINLDQLLLIQLQGMI